MSEVFTCHSRAQGSGPELHAEASKKSQYKQELLVVGILCWCAAQFSMTDANAYLTQYHLQPIRLDVTNEESVTKAAESIASHLRLSGGKVLGAA